MGSSTEANPETSPETSEGLVLDDERLQTFLVERERLEEPLEEPLIADFLGETLTLTARLIPSEAGSLLLDSPGQIGTGDLTFVAAFGEASQSLLGTAIRATSGIAGHVYQNGILHRANDMEQDPHFLGDLGKGPSEQFRSRSVIAAPLYFQDRVCGVFELVNRIGQDRIGQDRISQDGFSDHDAEIVKLISGYISRALLNAIDVLKKNRLALFDDLTGLRNSRGMDQALHLAIEHALEAGSDVGVLFIDLDHLKEINDSQGHRYGSASIAHTARVIRDVTAEHGTAFRFGGDEFVVLIPAEGSRAPALLTDLAEQILVRVREAGGASISGGGILPNLSVSIGLALLARDLGPHEEQTSTQIGTRLLAAADRALYRAKRMGRDRIAQATRRDDTLRRPITGVVEVPDPKLD